MTLTHITINTAKLNDSLAFYQDILGLHIVRDMRGRGPFNIAFLADDHSDVCIELVENPDQSYQGSGLSIGFAADDLDQALEDLKKKGIATGPIITPNPHTRFFFIPDPNGVQIQFIEEK